MTALQACFLKAQRHKLFRSAKYFQTKGLRIFDLYA